MTARWRIRAATLSLAWMAVVVALALMEMRPSVTVLAAIAVVVATVLWFLLDIGDLAAPVDWRAHSDGGVSGRGSDTRVRVLRRQISDGRALDGSASLHRALVDVIDDALLATHGIERSSQPGPAERALPPRLASFVASPPSRDLLTDPSELARLLDDIERFTGPSDPSDTGSGRGPTTHRSAIPQTEMPHMETPHTETPHTTDRPGPSR